MNSPPQLEGTAIDLFAGAGGVTAGFKAAGARVLAAVEMDPKAAATYRANHSDVHLFQADIRDVDPLFLMQTVGILPGELTVLGACAPCQGFSTLGTRKVDDPRNDLVLKVLDFVAALRPKSIAFENVPLLQKDWRFSAFLGGLQDLGYGTRDEIVDAAWLMVPQRRRRLVLLAIAERTNDSISPLVSETGKESEQVTVRVAFAKLPSAGGDDELHVPSQYSNDTLARIRAIPKDGGSRRHLPVELQLRCHAEIGSHASNIYGRMKWDDVAPTLTTRCVSPSCGRFLHPEEDRAITLREAAILQTFPPLYKFVGGRMSIESQIGNAIPLRMASAIWLNLAGSTRQ